MHKKGATMHMPNVITCLNKNRPEAAMYRQLILTNCKRKQTKQKSYLLLVLDLLSANCNSPSD